LDKTLHIRTTFSKFGVLFHRKDGDSEYDLKVCDDGTLIQVLCFWTLSIFLSLSKNRPVYI
jgi:hypothetical protein